jgi:hypothetical protein
MEKQERLEKIRAQQREINGLTEDIPPLVRSARMAGATWEEIGAALGMSRQSAHHGYAAGLGYDYPLNANEADL